MAERLGASDDETDIVLWNRIRYDFSQVKDIRQYIEYEHADTLKVILYIGDFGRYKIVAIEKVEG